MIIWSQQIDLTYFLLRFYTKSICINVHFNVFVPRISKTGFKNAPEPYHTIENDEAEFRY